MADLRCKRIIEYDIHSTLVDFIDSVSPYLDSAIMLVEEGRVQDRVAVCTPRLVHKNSASKVNTLLQTFNNMSKAKVDIRRRGGGGSGKMNTNLYAHAL